MATEMEDTLQPSGVSGSGFLDTASVKGYKASESLICDDDSGILGYKASDSLIQNDDNGILRLSVQGFDLSESGRSCWEDVEILRAGHRKVAIQLSDIKDNSQDRKSGHSLVIDLDRVQLDPFYIYLHRKGLQCSLKLQENAKFYLLGFKAMQDLFHFQEVFTGFHVETHISDVRVSLPESGVTIFDTAIQLWRKVPAQHESFNVTTDAPHNWRHARDAEKGRARSENEGLSTKTDPTTASNIGPNLSNGSAMEIPASSLLVFGGQEMLRVVPYDEPIWSSIPLDGKLPSTRQCRCGKMEGTCKHITFGEEVDPTSYWRKLPPPDPLWESRGIKPSAVGVKVPRSLTATQSRLLRKFDTIRQHLNIVELDFRTMEDKMNFKAAYDALRRLTELDGFRRQNRPLLRKETPPSESRSPTEQGSIGRKYEPAAIDAGNMIPTVLQKGDNTEITPFYRAKAEKGDSLTLVPHSPPALAGDASSHIGETVCLAEDERRNRRFEFGERERIESVERARRRQQREEEERYRRRDEAKRLAEEDEESYQRREEAWRRHEEADKERLRQQQDRMAEQERLGRLRRASISRQSLFRQRPDDWVFDADRLNPKIELDNVKWGSSVSDDGQKESIRQAITFNFSSDSEDASFVLKNSEDEKQGPRSETQANRETQRADIETSTKREQHQGLRSGHPPFSIFEHNLAKVSESMESEPSASFVWETSGDEEQVLKPEKQVHRKIQRASIETSTKREQWRRRICRRIVVFMLWKREQHIRIPNELWSSPASFDFINVLEISTSDKVKGLFETYSGREWNWWPLSAPAKPLESGRVRIRWQCACGDQRWTDASKYLARKCQALVNENPTAAHESGNAASQSESSAASHSQLKGDVPGSFPSNASQLPGDASNICTTGLASHIQNTYNNANSKDLYVLFCVYQKSQILHSQILATRCQNDEVFFENLRQEYRRLRGFFRFWFSPLQFSHCDFVKFTRFYVNELAKVGHSLPSELIYEYNPRPPGPHDDPPISPHEFRRRFYTTLGNHCGRSEALERIPKRQKRFQVNLHVDGREDMWGLLVELQPCFLTLLIWQIIITAGGWAFMGWWLSRHQGDLQDAAMPITLIITALLALWAPIGKGMRETL